MGLKSIFGKRKYLLRIYIVVTAIILAFILAFSGFIYYRVQKNLVENEISNGKKVLVQMRNNIQNIDDIVRSICMTNYYSNDIQALMFLKEKDSFVEINAIQKLTRSVINTNFFIQSVYVYNNNRKILFSTENPVEHTDKNLNEKIAALGTVPVLKPVLRGIETKDANGNKKVEQVISYFYYEQTDQQKEMDGAIIVNIKLDWLFANINEVNNMDVIQNEKIIFMNNEGELINEKNSKTSLSEGILKLLETQKSDLSATNTAVGSYTKTIDGEKYLLTYAKMTKNDWVLFKVRPYTDIFDSISSFRTLIFLITAGFILLALAAAVAVSGIIYRPVAGILNQMKSGYAFLRDKDDTKDGTKDETKDEISLIKDTINNSFMKLEKFQVEKNSNSRIIKMYFLMRLLTESSSITKEELIAGCCEHHISLDPEGKFSVCVVKMDKYQKFKDKFNEEDRKLYKFAISNIITETLSESFRCETIDTQEDQIAVILNTSVEDKNFYTKLQELLEQASKYTEGYYGFSISASVSEISDDYKDIAKMHQRAAINSMYRYVLGRGKLITKDRVMQNNRNLASNFNFENEGRFMELVRKGDIQQAEKRLQILFSELRDINYNDVMFYTNHFTNSLRNIICEMNEGRQEPINVSSILSTESMQELETLDELYQRINEILDELKTDVDSSVNEKQKMLANTIKDIIDANYHNPDLSVTFITDMLKLSPTYIGKVFNDCMKVSIPEYVNEIRMTKAVEWLENSKLNVNEVMQRVGIENQSYFYKLFKSKYGTTPRGYIQR